MQDDPLLEPLDWFFSSSCWTTSFPNTMVLPLGKPVSDHIPCVVTIESSIPKSKLFRFENFWIKMPGFKEIVQGAWNQNVNHVDLYHMFFHKLKKISQALRKWSKTIFAHSKVQLHMALEVILRLDVAQELRPLSVEERDICTRLKRKVVALAVMERARKRQNLRITISKMVTQTPASFTCASTTEEERTSSTV